MTGSRTRKKYDREFKQRAVRMVVDRGLPLTQVARDLGLHSNMLSRWKKEYLDDQDSSFPGKGKQKPEDEEIRRLKRELADAKEERDILKKAVAFFAKHPD